VGFAKIRRAFSCFENRILVVGYSRAIFTFEPAMPRWVFGASLSLIVAAMAAGAFVWYVDRPSSYDECVVNEMRGQSSSMFLNVSKVCAVRFKKEEDVPLSNLRERLDFMKLPDFKKDPDVGMAGGKLRRPLGS
jgi:hypothetical protein